MKAVALAEIYLNKKLFKSIYSTSQKVQVEIILKLTMHSRIIIVTKIIEYRREIKFLTAKLNYFTCFSYVNRFKLMLEH